MTTAQKTAQANFKKAIAYRKKTGCSLKEAFAHVKGSPVSKKKTAKKIDATMIIEKGESKTKRPTKVVQIKRNKKGTFKSFKTVGSMNTLVLKDFYKAINDCNRVEHDINSTKEKMKTLPVAQRGFLQRQIDLKNKYLSELKKHKSELKKLL